MAEMAAFLPIASTVMQTITPIAAGIQEDRAARSVAAQYDAQANTVVAASQRAAAEERRQGRLALSRVQAVAGGGGNDVGVVNIAGDIAAESEYRALSALFEGNDRAAGLRFAGDTKRWEGSQARTAGFIKGATTVMNQTPGLFEKYGKGKLEYDFKRQGYGDKY